jgi:hypothetical protein
MRPACRYCAFERRRNGPDALCSRCFARRLREGAAENSDDERQNRGKPFYERMLAVARANRVSSSSSSSSSSDSDSASTDSSDSTDSFIVDDVTLPDDAVYDEEEKVKEEEEEESEDEIPTDVGTTMSERFDREVDAMWCSAHERKHPVTDFSAAQRAAKDETRYCLRASASKVHRAPDVASDARDVGAVARRLFEAGQTPTKRSKVVDSDSDSDGAPVKRSKVVDSDSDDARR